MENRDTKSKPKKAESRIMKVEFDNGDGTVDEWVYDKSYNPARVIQVTLNIRRRKPKKS